MRSFYFQNYSNNAQTNEPRVKNLHAGTLINKNVIIPPNPPHPTPPHPPTPSHPPEQTLACQHATINATASRNTAKRAEHATTHTKTRKHVRWHGCFGSDANMKKWQHSATPSRGPYHKLPLWIVGVIIASNPNQRNMRMVQPTNI